jgi:oxygen-independent coproporphyrinogen-3 oxidase
MSYTDIFALRFCAEGGPPALKPSQARQACFGCENQHPLRKNVLYLHVPFCASRCRYCPYYSHPYAPDLMSAYLEALTKEVAMVSETPYVRSTRFWCVYFGGGTPSLLRPDDLEKLSVLLHRNFNLTADVEMTFEANPSTLTEEKVKLLRPLGFNRVSLGVQSFQDAVLRKMRCAHSAALARRAIQSVLEQGLMLNVDLLFGWAGQTQADLEFELAQLCAGGLPHQVTLFPLRMAKGTPLAEELQQQGALDVMSHNRRLLEFDALVEKRLREHSFIRSDAPISYYREDARPHRYQSVEGRIVGLGAGAGSVLEGAESVNHREVARYIRQLREHRCPAAHDGYSTREQARERYVLFRILFMNRSRAGFREIVTRRFEEYYDEPLGTYYEKVVQDLQRRAYVELVGERIVFTERLWNMLAGLEIGTPSIL